MLREREAQEYWKERASKLKKKAVGFGDQTLKTQDAIYAQRKNFIFQYVSRLSATIDYGCGIGRYADDFLGKYVGYDMTKELLEIAKNNHPDRKFIHLKQPYFSPPEEGKIELILDRDKGSSWFDQFFTATVLQHCHYDVVMKLLKSIKWDVKARDFTFCFYENSCKFEKPHIVGRSPDQYWAMVHDAGFTIVDFDYHTHELKREAHSLTRIKVL